MKLIRPEIIITDMAEPDEILNKLEKAARTCYQSNDKEKKTSPEKFLGAIVKRGHESVLEHVNISFRVITDRAISHEWVRHRIGCSYSQESTRYCKYGGDGDIVFINHYGINDDSVKELIHKNYEESENVYNYLIDAGVAPQIARQVLPNGLKTEFYCTMNIRSLRNFFKLRADKAAHPFMKELAIPFLIEMQSKLPCLFDDIPYDTEFEEKYLHDAIMYVVCYEDDSDEELKFPSLRITYTEEDETE